MKRFRCRHSLAGRSFCAMLLLVAMPLCVLLLMIESRFASYFKEQLGSNISVGITRSKFQIEGVFSQIVDISNMICTNGSIQSALQDDTVTYYQRVKQVDEAVRHFMWDNSFVPQNTQFTLIAENGDIYSNWSRNFHDYSFIRDLDWVQASIRNKGYLEWGSFEKPYIYEDDPEDKYIGVARGIVDNVDGKLLGNLIVTIRESSIQEILETYRMTDRDAFFVFDASGQPMICSQAPEDCAPALEELIRQAILSGDHVPLLQSADRRNYFLTHYETDSTWAVDDKAMLVYYFTDYSIINDTLREITGTWNRYILLTFAIVLCMMALLTSIGVRPIRHLARAMQNYDLHKQYPEYTPARVRRTDEIGTIQCAFSEMDWHIKDLFARLKKENEIKEQYKLNYLKAQLTPHFLFNTLNTIRWMALVQKMDNIVESIDALSAMLQYSMNRTEELVTLKDEMKNLDGYIKIQNYRYGNRYELIRDIPPEHEELKIVRFILQPSVENAVLHGFRNHGGQGTIRISSTIRDSVLSIVIEDDGVGMTPELMAELNRCAEAGDPSRSAQASAQKIGIANISQQINIRYGREYGLHFESNSPQGTRIIYRLPVIRNTDREERQDV